VNVTRQEQTTRNVSTQQGIPVTAIVTTRNEELNIERCLSSLHGFVRSIFVLDSESNDQTVAIARRYADVYTLPYDHSKIIPWIFQWGLDHLPIETEWVLLMEADQSLTAELKQELQQLFARNDIKENGFYIRRKQIFRGKWIRFGGYGSKYLLKLFRRTAGELDPEEQDTRVYVRGPVVKLDSPLIEQNVKEESILFYLEKHLRYADAFAHEEFNRGKTGFHFKIQPSWLRSPDHRILQMKAVYYRLPLFIRPFLYFAYRYFFLLGFLDGKVGFLFHFLQSFWFRLIVDARLEELRRAGRSALRE
jgi:glycosyltransferase involved in cell wall biosynthesis